MSVTLPFTYESKEDCDDGDFTTYCNCMYNGVYYNMITYMRHTEQILILQNYTKNMEDMIEVGHVFMYVKPDLTIAWTTEQ